ncbi:hypothetical protein CDD83_9055 [Cordyceps sp. RAO-2017]|nr:hypothetical protein CDD83_9055 [Cordyceps sp. RAO-2017]
MPPAPTTRSKKRPARTATMSKLSQPLKSLIHAPSALPGPVGAPAGMRDVYERIAKEAARHKLGTRPWLAISAAATMTLNSPDSLAILHRVASEREAAAAPKTAPTTTKPSSLARGVQTAEFMREVGLKQRRPGAGPSSTRCTRR